MEENTTEVHLVQNFHVAFKVKYGLIDTNVTIAVESQFKQLRSSPQKGFSGPQWDSNSWPLRSRCSTLPAEL